LLKYNQSASGDGTSTQYSLINDGKENIMCAYARRQSPTVL